MKINFRFVVMALFAISISTIFFLKQEPSVPHRQPTSETFDDVLDLFLGDTVIALELGLDGTITWGIKDPVTGEDPNYDHLGNLKPEFRANSQQTPTQKKTPPLDPNGMGGIPNTCWVGRRRDLDMKSFCQRNLSFLAGEALVAHNSKASKVLSDVYDIDNCTFETSITFKGGKIVGADSLDRADWSYLFLIEKGVNNRLEGRPVPYKMVLKAMEQQCPGIVLHSKIIHSNLEKLADKYVNISNIIPFSIFQNLLASPAKEAEPDQIHLDSSSGDSTQ